MIKYLMFCTFILIISTISYGQNNDSLCKKRGHIPDKWIDYEHVSYDSLVYNRDSTVLYRVTPKSMDNICRRCNQKYKYYKGCIRSVIWIRETNNFIKRG